MLPASCPKLVQGGGNICLLLSPRCCDRTPPSTASDPCPPPLPSCHPPPHLSSSLSGSMPSEVSSLPPAAQGGTKSGRHSTEACRPRRAPVTGQGSQAPQKQGGPHDSCINASQTTGLPLSLLPLRPHPHQNPAAGLLQWMRNAVRPPFHRQRDLAPTKPEEKPNPPSLLLPLRPHLRQSPASGLLRWMRCTAHPAHTAAAAGETPRAQPARHTTPHSTAQHTQSATLAAYFHTVNQGTHPHPPSPLLPSHSHSRVG